MAHRLTVNLVPDARRLAYRYLRYNAPHAWAEMITRGNLLLVPPEMAHLPVADQARRLAITEAQRIAKAQLFYFDASATQMAVAGGGLLNQYWYSLRRELLPAEHGMIVWAEDVSATENGVPVIACHWQARDDGVWAVWWTDTVSLARQQIAAGAWTRQEAETILDTRGLLIYERERLLPYGAGQLESTQPDTDRDAVVEAMTSTTIASWALLSQQMVTTTRLPNPSTTVGNLSPIPGGCDDDVTVAAAPPEVDLDALWSTTFNFLR